MQRGIFWFAIFNFILLVGLTGCGGKNSTAQSVVVPLPKSANVSSSSAAVEKPAVEPSPGKVTVSSRNSFREITHELLAQHPERICRIYREKNSKAQQLAFTFWVGREVYFVPAVDQLKKILPSTEISQYRRSVYDKVYSQERLGFNYHPDQWVTTLEKVPGEKDPLPVKYLASAEQQQKTLRFTLRTLGSEITKADFYLQGDCRFLEVEADRLSFFSAMVLVYQERGPVADEMDSTQPDALRLAQRAQVGLGTDDECVLSNFTYGRNAKPLTLFAVISKEKNSLRILKNWTQPESGPVDFGAVANLSNQINIKLRTNNTNRLNPSVAVTLVPKAHDGWRILFPLFKSGAFFNLDSEYSAYEKQMFYLRGLGCDAATADPEWLKQILLTAKLPEKKNK